ncbi:MAG: hypothetical protein WC881_09140, partial [Elusimicrobiota bacterium]
MKINEKSALSLALAVILLSPSAAPAAILKAGPAKSAGLGLPGSPIRRAALPGARNGMLPAPFTPGLTAGLNFPALPSPRAKGPAAGSSFGSASAQPAGEIGPSVVLPQAARPEVLAALQNVSDAAGSEALSAGNSASNMVFTQFFDGSAARRAVPADSAGRELTAGQGHLSRPPQSVVPDVVTVWQPAAAAAEPDLDVRQNNGPVEKVGTESVIAELSPVGTEAVAVELPEPALRDDKAALQSWLVAGGVRYAAMVSGGV